MPAKEYYIKKRKKKQTEFLLLIGNHCNTLFNFMQLSDTMQQKIEFVEKRAPNFWT
jgi:poly(3-hydroxyalkanoate) synthetase